jgi:hypothetical protein
MKTLRLLRDVLFLGSLLMFVYFFCYLIDVVVIGA